MKNDKKTSLSPVFTLVTLILSAIGILLGLFVLSAYDKNMFFSVKISFAYTLFALIVLFILTMRISKKLFLFTADMLRKYENVERLLLDLRDNTRTFYKEKRKSSRILNNITVKITDENSSQGFATILNGGETGALLRTSHKFKLGELATLSIYLPLFPQPITIKVKIARVAPSSEKASGDFDVGVEFLKIERPDKEKLLETLRLLGDNTAGTG
ncbi:MAG: PilZ domain-containing protein [Candidatus Omnitrophica bacterium]|nr:PilZ domain-containing protein [Candidatus Omnitrophota bacterium]